MVAIITDAFEFVKCYNQIAMGFSLGIVGLPNVGKSTLFNLLSTAKAEVSNYPFCTISPNVGVVEVPDERLGQVQKIIGSAQAFPTVIEFFDIAGLVKGAHKGEGLGNQFLSHIREVDAILHVLRCFKQEEVAHVPGEVDPIRDLEIVNTELILADLNLVEKRLEEFKIRAKSGDKKVLKGKEFLEKLRDELVKGKPARRVKIEESEKEFLVNFPLLTLKPILYVANVDESGNPQWVEKIEAQAAKEGTKAIALCAKLETEIGELNPEDAQAYLKALGYEEPGLKRLIQASYQLLDLITFFTANEKETRAWTIKRGTKLPKAAGKIHSDMERGFISAEVVHYVDLIAAGSYIKAREKGLIHVEGKEYQVQDGDLILVRFVV